MKDVSRSQAVTYTANVVLSLKQCLRRSYYRPLVGSDIWLIEQWLFWWRWVAFKVVYLSQAYSNEIFVQMRGPCAVAELVVLYNFQNVACCCVHPGSWAGSPPCRNRERNTIGCTGQRQTKSLWMDSSSAWEVLLNWAPEHSDTSDISSSLQHLGFSKWRCHYQGILAQFSLILILHYWCH